MPLQIHAHLIDRLPAMPAVEREAHLRRLDVGLRAGGISGRQPGGDEPGAEPAAVVRGEDGEHVEDFFKEGGGGVSLVMGKRNFRWDEGRWGGGFGYTEGCGAIEPLFPVVP